jgi:hypothetical protein
MTDLHTKFFTNRVLQSTVLLSAFGSGGLYHQKKFNGWFVALCRCCGGLGFKGGGEKINKKRREFGQKTWQLNVTNRTFQNFENSLRIGSRKR